MIIFKETEDEIPEKVRSIMNVGNPTKEGLRPFEFSGPGYSAGLKQEVQKVLPALPVAPKGNNDG